MMWVGLGYYRVSCGKHLKPFGGGCMMNIEHGSSVTCWHCCAIAPKSAFRSLTTSRDKQVTLCPLFQVPREEGNNHVMWSSTTTCCCICVFVCRAVRERKRRRGKGEEFFLISLLFSVPSFLSIFFESKSPSKVEIYTLEMKFFCNLAEWWRFIHVGKLSFRKTLIPAGKSGKKFVPIRLATQKAARGTGYVLENFNKKGTKSTWKRESKAAFFCKKTSHGMSKGERDW